MELFNKALIDQLADEARHSERLRVNHLIHKSKDEKCQRLLDVLHPGTILPIHRHTIEETLFILKGEIDVIYYNAEGVETERCTLNPEKDVYGIRIDADVWHAIDVKAADSVLFEVKEGPFRVEDTEFYKR